MKRVYLLMVILVLGATGSVFAVTIDNFDNITFAYAQDCWNIYAPSGGGCHQGRAPGDPVAQGTGSMVFNYTPGGSADAIYAHKYLDNHPLNLSADAAAGGYMSMDMWVASSNLGARLYSITCYTGGDYFQYALDLSKTWNAGWNTLAIPFVDFAVSGSPTWSHITGLELQTTMYPTPPDQAEGPVVLDDWKTVPEPVSLVLLGLGGLMLRRRK
jgi:hypothetical protein